MSGDAAGEVRAHMLGLLADSLATVEEAREHNYMPLAAWAAALDHMLLADETEARMIAATLAMLIVCDMKLTRPTDFGAWLESNAEFLSGQRLL